MKMKPAEYMKNENIEINVDIGHGKKFYCLYNGFNKKIY